MFIAACLMLSTTMLAPIIRKKWNYIAPAMMFANIAYTIEEFKERLIN